MAVTYDPKFGLDHLVKVLTNRLRSSVNLSLSNNAVFDGGPRGAHFGPMDARNAVLDLLLMLEEMEGFVLVDVHTRERANIDLIESIKIKRAVANLMHENPCAEIVLPNQLTCRPRG